MLSSNLKLLRKFSQLTQLEFGELFQLTRSNVDSYERGNARPRNEVLIEISKYFNISLDDIHSIDLKKRPELLNVELRKSTTTHLELEKLLIAKQETIDAQRQLIDFLKKKVEDLTLQIEGYSSKSLTGKGFQTNSKDKKPGSKPGSKIPNSIPN